MQKKNYNISKLRFLKGWFFVLLGIVFFISQRFSISGAVISTKGISEAGMTVSICSLLIGGILLVRELKKGKSFKKK